MQGQAAGGSQDHRLVTATCSSPEVTLTQIIQLFLCTPQVLASIPRNKNTQKRHRESATYGTVGKKTVRGFNVWDIRSSAWQFSPALFLIFMKTVVNLETFSTSHSWPVDSEDNRDRKRKYQVLRDAEGRHLESSNQKTPFDANPRRQTTKQTQPNDLG